MGKNKKKKKTKKTKKNIKNIQSTNNIKIEKMSEGSIELTSLDTLFFRDGKPFTMGVESWADTTFPPTPSVLYGSLRTAYFSQNMNIFQDRLNDNSFNSDKDNTSKLEITGIYYKIKDGSCCLPLPMDYMRKKGNKKNDDKTHLIPLVKLNGNNLYRDIDFEYALNVPDDYENVSDALIEVGDFNRYLMGKNANEIEVKELEKYKYKEPKVGISRSRITLSSEDHELYRVGMTRMKDLSFVIDFKELELNNSGLMKLGGEGKAVSYNIQKYTEKIDQPKFTNDEKMFKLIITTPAVFKNGWLPSWIDRVNLEGIIPETDIQVKLVAASCNKSIVIGGFDMVKRKPKPMRKAVAPGSVYYFRVENGGDINEIVEKLHGKAISDNIDHHFSNINYMKQGFGISYIGKVSIEKEY